MKIQRRQGQHPTFSSSNGAIASGFNHGLWETARGAPGIFLIKTKNRIDHSLPSLCAYFATLVETIWSPFLFTGMLGGHGGSPPSSA